MLNLKSYLLIGLILFIQNSFSQERVSEEKDYIPSQSSMELKSFMEDFSTQTGFFFSYSPEIIDRTYDLHFRQGRYGLYEALRFVFLNTDITYSTHKNVIILRKAFRYSVIGEISDESDNSPLAYATLTVESINKGAIADENGRFSLVLKEGTYVMKFFCFGYHPIQKEVKVDSDISLENIRLSSMILELEPVVIEHKKSIRDIHDPDAFINDTYFQYYSGKDLNFLALPGEIRLANDQILKGLIRIKPHRFIRKIQYKEPNKEKQQFIADSVKSFTQKRLQEPFNFAELITYLSLNRNDSLSKNPFKIFFKKESFRTDSSYRYINPDEISSYGVSDYEKYITIGMGNINPFYYYYESKTLPEKKEKRVFLSKIVDGNICVYTNPRKFYNAKNNKPFNFEKYKISFFPIPFLSNLPFGHYLFSFRKKEYIKSSEGSMENKIIIEKRFFYIQKHEQLIKIKPSNYRKNFSYLFGDCDELMNFVADRRKLKKFKNIIKLVIIYNYLNYYDA